MQVSSKACIRCRANFTYLRNRRAPKLCPVCCASGEVLREYMEDARPFKLKVGKHVLRPHYYLHYGDAIRVGHVIAYRFCTGIRIGMITSNFISNEYSMVTVINRNGMSSSTMKQDEVTWNNVLCVLESDGN